MEWAGLEQRLRIPNEEGKRLVVAFLYGCLRWRPGERKSAFGLLESAWMGEEGDGWDYEAGGGE